MPHPKVFYNNWFSYPIGRAGFGLNPTFSWDAVTNTSGLLGVELYIDTGDKERNDKAFQVLFSQREIIESEIGTQLDWQPLEDARACRIRAHYPEARDIVEVSDEEWMTMLNWTKDHVLLFSDVFGPKIRNL